MRNDVPCSRNEVGGIVGGEPWRIFPAGGSECLWYNRICSTLLERGRGLYSNVVGLERISRSEGLFWLLWLKMSGDHDLVKL